MPSAEKVARTDSGLASALRVSVARLQRRLRSERDPDNAAAPGGAALRAGPAEPLRRQHRRLSWRPSSACSRRP